MDQPTVAVLGTGIMGAPMARNLLAKGFAVRVWNRTAAKAKPLAEHGAVVADQPAEAVAGADVVITVLSDAETTAEAMASAAPGLSAGAVWAQMGTVGVAGTETLAALAAQHALSFVDAPVLGTKQPAELGKLVVLAAAPEPLRAQLGPIFAAVGQRTVWVSQDAESAAASRLKLVVNSWILSLTGAVGEALALANGLGVDPQLFLDAVAGGPVDCLYLQAKSAAIIADDYTPSFSVRNAEKDARLVGEAAAAAGVTMDLTAAARERFRRSVALGHGDEDMAAAYFASF